MHAIPARVISSCFALACFAGAVIFGAYNGNSALSIVGWALGAMFAAYVVGSIIGSLAQRCVDDHIKQHALKNPVPGDDTFVSDTSQEIDQIDDPIAATTPVGT